MDKKIRDIYHTEAITTDLDDTLVEWHNNVIEKTVDQLTKEDVARCIRQDIFVESATEALLGYLLGDPLAGELYEGELMEKAADIDEAVMRKYSKIIRKIVRSARETLKNHEWPYDDDGEERGAFKEAVDALDRKYLQ